METEKRCIRCIMPYHYPNLTFDKDMLCSECRDYQPIQYAGIEKLKTDISQILQKYPNRKYDCIFGTSGGRDSTYLLHILCKELKLKTLAFLINHAYLPEHTFNNVQKLTKKTGADIVIVNNKRIN